MLATYAADSLFNKKKLKHSSIEPRDFKSIP